MQKDQFSRRALQKDQLRTGLAGNCLCNLTISWHGTPLWYGRWGEIPDGSFDGADRERGVASSCCDRLEHRGRTQHQNTLSGKQRDGKSNAAKSKKHLSLTVPLLEAHMMWLARPLW